MWLPDFSAISKTAGACASRFALWVQIVVIGGLKPLKND
jgi:hypothetical protein